MKQSSVGGGAAAALPYVLHNRSTKAKSYENKCSVNKNGKDTNSERLKCEKKGKTFPFISPGRIKSRLLDHASTAGGSKTRLTVGIKSLFRNSNR